MSPDFLAATINGWELDQLDFTGYTDARELVETGQCSGACLVANPATQIECDCVCGGDYHGELANSLIERNKTALATARALATLLVAGLED